jgi:hypothetical protein
MMYGYMEDGPKAMGEYPEVSNAIMTLATDGEVHRKS